MIAPGVLNSDTRATCTGAVGTDASELLEALRRRPAWQSDALCKEYPRVDFFPGHGEPQEPAQAVCRRCAVSSECLEFALSLSGWTSGIWGGTTHQQRRDLRRKPSGDHPTPEQATRPPKGAT